MKLEESRDVFLRSIDPEDFAKMAKEFAPRIVVPLAMHNTGGSTRMTPTVPGNPFQFRVAVCPPGNQIEIIEAHLNNNHAVMGRLLGYPKCCVDFFVENWGKRFDFGMRQLGNSKQIFPVANTLLRHTGIRLVPHLPCSFECNETFNFHHRLLERTQFTDSDNQTIQWTRELLDLDFKWSVNHGVAEIENSIFRICHDTDWTDKTYSFTKGARPKVNGFKNPQAMDESHKVIVDTLHPSNDPAFFWDTVIDFGAGDGTLLNKINAKEKIAVEIDSTILNKQGHARFYCDIKDFKFIDLEVDLAIISLQRFAEMSESELKTFMNKVFVHCRNLLVYVYLPWDFKIISPIMLQLLLSEKWQSVKNNFAKDKTSAVLLRRVSDV